MKLLREHPIENQRVLVRVDFNVPILGGRVQGDFRIRRHLETITKLIRAGNTVILLSHHTNRAQTLRPVVKTLERMLGRRVLFLADPFRKYAHLPRGASVFLFENLRQWPGEEACARSFARSIAAYGDVFVNDAFSVSHRRAASTVVLSSLMPSYLGLLFERELKNLDALTRHPARPFVAVFGGAKTETKLPLLERFSRLADWLIVGGAIANTVLRAGGVSVGRSNIDSKALGAVKRLARSSKVITLDDAVVAGASHERPHIVSVASVGEREAILDIGPQTIARYRRILKNARTVVWNGPVGLIEVAAFTHGTIALARMLAESKAKVIVGGGDTVAFLETHRLLSKFKHVSTGGGAMLAYLGGEKLPGLEALKRVYK